MAFDLSKWPLTSPTNADSHAAPITQVWLKFIEVSGQSMQKLQANVNPFHNDNADDTDIHYYAIMPLLLFKPGG